MNRLLCFLLIVHASMAQRFMGKGFSNQMDSDFQGEMKLDEDQVLSGMTREMFLMQDASWELQPPVLKTGQLNRKLQSHIQKYLNAPLQLKLLKKRGKYGLRAVGQMDNGRKLRAFWRQGTVDRLKASDFLEVSYDEAVRSRLFVVEFEVQLPPLKKFSKTLPSVVYQIPLEPGSMNAKSMVPRSSGTIRVYPEGRAVPPVEAGIGNAGMSMKPGLVDHTWAKGRTIFRKGRSKGLM
jgi:hypothetical protein